jgi:hypothetical protein
VTQSLDDLIPLLYRVKWHDLCLSAEVSHRVVKPHNRPRPQEPSDREDHIEYRGMIQLAPGGRYRVDLTDQDGDDYAAGSDGRTPWEVIEGVPALLSPIESMRIPLKNLLEPHWLIAGHAIDAIEATVSDGRPAYRIHAMPRQGSKGRTGSRQSFAEVNGLIDARLGILLRCETLDRRGAHNVFELSDIQEIPPAAHSGEIFRPPAKATDQHIAVSVPLANSAKQPVHGHQLSSAVTDEELNLIYRTHLPPAEFTAILREQSNPSLMIQAARPVLDPSSATVSRIANNWLVRNLFTKYVPKLASGTAEVQISMPDRCRIDFRNEGSRGTRSIVYDRHQAATGYRSGTGIRAAKSFPMGIGFIVDLAWLLDGYQLSSDGPEMFSGRTAIRFKALSENATGEILTGPLSDHAVPVDEIEVSVDRELGIAVRLVGHFRGQLALACELSELSPHVRAGAFRSDPFAD